MRTPDGRVDALRSLAAEAPLVVRVKGGCMAPELPDGAAVSVARRSRYLPGEVVAFGASLDGLTLHRVIGYRLVRGRFALLTQADSGDAADRPITPAAIVGRVEGVLGDDGAVRKVTSRRALALRRWLGWFGAGLVRRFRRTNAPAL